MIDEILAQFLTPEGLKKIQNISNQEKTQLIDMLTRGEERVNFSYLTSTVRIIKNFLNQGQEIIGKAQEFAEQGDNHENEMIRKMIEKTKINISKQMFREKNLQAIGELGSSDDKEFIKIFKQLPNEQEKIREFRRCIHKELLEPYTSNMTIFCEEMRNLSKFTGNRTTTTNNIEAYFNEMTSKLLTQIKLVKLDINYAPLFDNYEKYAAFVRLANNESSILYAHINGLKKDDISEILSYGFGSEETKVLLKSTS